MTGLGVMFTSRVIARTSSHYSLLPESVEPGGESASSSYSIEGGSMGSFGGAATSSSYSLRHGFVIPQETSQPDIAVEQPAGNPLIDNTSLVDFGPVVGDRKASASFIVRNHGDAELSDLRVEFSGPHAADFSTETPTLLPLAPSTTLNFFVDFDPSESGDRTAILHLRSNDADEDPFDVMLTGEGIPETTLNGWQDGHGLSDEPPTSNAGDNDFITLLEEYAFNLVPTADDYHILTPGTGTSGMPHIDLAEDGGTPGQFRLRVEYLRRRGDVNLTYTVQFASGLDAVDWMSSGGGETVTHLDSTWERVVVEDSMTTADEDGRFGRIELNHVAPQ